MKRYTPDTLPASAAYLGSTEGPDTMSEETADRLNDATAPLTSKTRTDANIFLTYAPLNPKEITP